MGVKEGGEFLKLTRKKVGLTQVGVSLAAGFNEDGTQRLTLEQVTRLERGIIENPPMSALCALGEVCRVTPNEIAEAYGYWSNPGEPIGELSKALSAAASLDQEMQEYVAKVIYGTIATVEEQKSTGEVKAIKKK